MRLAMATGSSRFASSVRVKYTISHPAEIIGVCPGPMKNASPASNTSSTPLGYPHAVLAFQHIAYVGRLALIVRCALKEKRGVQVGQVGFHADGPAIDFVRISVKHPGTG